MIDPIQVLLFAVVIVLTTMLVIIGWQVFQILSEIRKMLVKSNVVIDSATETVVKVSESIQRVSGFTEGMKSAFSVLQLFKKKLSKEEDKHEREK